MLRKPLLMLLLVSSLALTATGWSANESPWLEYHRYAPELVQHDPTPLLRIYDDGRVLVYKARYMRAAGLYEGFLTVSEMAHLRSIIGGASLASLDLGTVAIEVAKQAIERKSEGILYGTSEHTISYFAINDKGSRVWSWKNLQSDDQRFDVDGLKALAQLERAMLTLRQRSGLAKIGFAAGEEQAK